MSEPPRPPGEYGSPSDPNYPPPTSGGGYTPPTSGAGYQPGYDQQQYQQPGAYGYQQPGAYGTPGAPVGYANSDEKTWALIAHFGGIVLGFIAPLIALLAKGNESPTVKAHANEALNFHITWGIAMIVAVVLSVCTFGILFFVPFLVWIFIIIFAIIGGMKANGGELYRYPATFRFIK
ncbi:DUF4870 domain-containing protein [Dactylosporangium sp. AC04546]|uniref:DUF4870 domain-containing protein n=1 Tax=Dactylosporangium sp. AC04546 TaxID=2862460 RepID=UPI001EDF3722|nr:DUF4870 domain-containing protein [Dactylosporangium sp. AC04546]WVK82572.1 DUF4870 domain-containing protein [Dactylosporangium sp. AC04546]